ncbi:MAG: RNA polymerase sporulation sigma factor SigG [Clostridia bacterium]
MLNNKVEICGVNTSKLPLLSKKEKEELFIKIKEGDNQARTEFINGNLRLVLSVIQRFYGRGEAADDLFQVGCVGLIKAIDNFDLSQNVQFSTYAVPMIIGEVKRYLRDNNSIRVSRSVRDLAYKAIQFKERYTKEKGKEPTIEEIAKELGVEREEIAFSFDAIQNRISLQEPIYNDGTENIYIIDQIKDTKNTDELWTENMTIAGALEKLNDKEKMIVSKRFFDGRTQMEVAEEIGISQAQVSRLEKSAIAHIKRLYK